MERVFRTVVGNDHAPASRVVEARHPTGERNSRLRQAQWTILARGSSIMSLAPASHRSGIKTLMSALGTTVSTA